MRVVNVTGRNRVALGVLAALLGGVMFATPATPPALEQREMQPAKRKQTKAAPRVMARGRRSPNRNARRKRAMLSKGVARAHI